MKLYKDVNEYLSKIKTTNVTLDSLIDAYKINKNIEQIKIDLCQLNYIIANDKEKMKLNIFNLYSQNPNVFKSLLILIGIRDTSKSFIYDNKEFVFNDFINSPENIITLMEKTNLFDLIIDNKITNFLDYLVGIEVGMDTNARKNRNGNNIEKNLYDNIVEIFNKRPEIKIYTQKYLNFNETILKNKRFDIVIHNINNNKYILIESSFYNTSGSKINETAKSYKDLNNILRNYNNYKFIWVADGIGMSSIKKILSKIILDGFIFTHEDLLKNINKLL